MFGVSFLFPIFLLGAVAVAVPIVLHLMKREAAPTEPFSAVRFLKRVPVAHARRKRLRELLLLALRVAALLLLALAFARPYLGDAADARSAPVTIVAVDTSMSLSAPGQVEQLRARALEALDGIPTGERAGLLTFADEARLLVEPLLDRAPVRAAIAELESGYGGTRYGPALSTAAETIGRRPGRVIVVTDLQRAGWEDGGDVAVPRGIEVEVLVVDPPPGNLAIDDVRSDGEAIVATVRHAGSAPLEVSPSLTIDDGSAHEAAVSLVENGATDVRFPVGWPEAGSVAVRVDDPVGFPGDDAFFTTAAEPPPVDLLVVGDTGAPQDDAFYLTSALRAAAGERRFAVSGAVASGLAAAGAPAPDRVAAIVLVSTSRLARDDWRAVADYVDAGGGLLVPLGPDVDPAVVGQILGDQAVASDETPSDARRTLAPTDLRHPIFRPFSSIVTGLGRIPFDRSITMAEPAEAPTARVLARFDDGAPAIVEHAMQEGRVLVFGSDLDREWNEFPLHPVFVPFVHETMRYLTRDRRQPRTYVIADRPPSLPARPGVVQDERTGRLVAVNVDPRESSLERMSAEEFRDAITRAPGPGAGTGDEAAVEVERSQSWWRYGLMLMLVALAAEGVLGGRLR